MDNQQNLWMMIQEAETALREMTLHTALESLGIANNLARQAELQGYIKCLLDYQPGPTDFATFYPRVGLAGGIERVLLRRFRAYWPDLSIWRYAPESWILAVLERCVVAVRMGTALSASPLDAQGSQTARPPVRHIRRRPSNSVRNENASAGTPDSTVVDSAVGSSSRQGL